MAEFGGLWKHTKKIPSMRPRLGSVTVLSPLAFPGEGNPSFPLEKSHLDNTVVRTLKKKKMVGGWGGLHTAQLCTLTGRSTYVRKESTCMQQRGAGLVWLWSAFPVLALFQNLRVVDSVCSWLFVPAPQLLKHYNDLPHDTYGEGSARDVSSCQWADSLLHATSLAVSYLVYCIVGTWVFVHRAVSAPFSCARSFLYSFTLQPCQLLSHEELNWLSEQTACATYLIKKKRKKGHYIK